MTDSIEEAWDSTVEAIREYGDIFDGEVSFDEVIDAARALALAALEEARDWEGPWDDLLQRIQVLAAKS
jgi:hypothetical protein